MSLCCVLGKDTLLTVPALLTQVKHLASSDLNGVGNPSCHGLALILGGCTKNAGHFMLRKPVQLWPDGPLSSYEDLFLPLQSSTEDICDSAGQVTKYSELSSAPKIENETTRVPIISALV